jgi:hypothetical protein
MRPFGVDGIDLEEVVVSGNKRRRLSYANVVATLALFAALGGSSYAAISITGTQVRDGSLRGRDVHDGSLTGRDVRDRSLLARDFKQGQLPPGSVGPQGPRGDAGKDGAQGPAGRSALTALQPGESESGVFSVGGPSTGAGVYIAVVNFPVPLSHSLDAAHVVAVDGVASVAHCPGQGQAEPGFLCLYVDGRSDMDPLTSTDIRDPALPPNSGANKRGFSVSGETNASTSFAGIVGTWTYAEGS